MSFLLCYCMTHACWASFRPAACLILVAQYCHWASIYTIFGLPWPILLLLGSFAPSHPFGHPRPISFPWHPRPIPILYSLRPLLSLLGFPGPNYYILYFWGLWAFHQPLAYLIHYFGPLWPILACFLFLI